MATKVGDAYVEISTRDSKLVAGLDKAQKNVGASMKNIGRSMTIAGAAITAGFAMAIKTAAKFEQSMANTASVAGATAEELKNLSDFAREMGEQSVFSASEAADAMYFLASAGMNTTEIMGALEGTLALAAATASDLAFTSESVAASLSQFGLDADEAGRIANVFAAAISGSQATMDKLSTSMSYVGPMAKSMGMSIEDTTGILMNLYNAGLQGSNAGTALRMAFVKLIEPTEAGAIALEKLEVAIKDSDGEMRPFKDIIDDLGIAGMSTADAMAIFGIRAGPAMMALVAQGTGSIQEMTDAVTGTEKATEMAEMQIDTFEGAIKLLRSAFEELQITLVQDLMPSIKGLIEDVTEGIKKVSDWMKANPKLTETIVKWGSAIGALMLVLGPLLIILPGLVTGVGLLAAAVTPLTVTIGLAVIAATALVFAFKKLYEVLDPFHTSVEDVTRAENILSEAQEKLAKKLSQELIPATYDFASILEEVEKVAKETEEAIKKLTETTDEFKAATKELADKIFDLTHTAMEIAIKKLDEERQAYIDLGISIKKIDKWYDLEIKKLEKLYKTKDKAIDKTKELGMETKKVTNINKQLADSYSDVSKELDKVTKKTTEYISPLMTISEMVATLGGYRRAFETGESAFSYQHGTPYVPRTGLAVVHKGEAIIPANQNTYDQRKNYSTSSINIQPGAIIINTPRFSGRDAKEMLAKIKREAAMQGYKFATA